MSYKLLKVEPDGNGYKDKKIELAISPSKQQLFEYSKTTYGVAPVDMTSQMEQKPDHLGDSFWSGWLEVHKSETKIIGKKSEKQLRKFCNDHITNLRNVVKEMTDNAQKGEQTDMKFFMHIVGQKEAFLSMIELLDNKHYN